MARKSFKQKAFDKVADEFHWYYYHENKLGKPVTDEYMVKQWHKAYDTFFAYNDIGLLNFDDLEDAKRKGQEIVEWLMSLTKNA